MARACGADVTLHELREDAGWAIDVDALRRQLTPRTKLIVINAPHNPTGMLPDRATFDAVVDIAEEAGAYLLVDEVYRYLEVDEEDRLPAGIDAGSHVISLGVMSKSFAMAGLRIGWLATPGCLGPATGRRVQGLHHDLRLGAGRDPVDHRAARARRRAGPLAGDRARRADRRRRAPDPLARPPVVGPAARRIDRVPAASCRPRRG